MSRSLEAIGFEGGAHPTAIALTINRRPVQAAAVPPTTTLLEFLRAAGWTSVKEGCAEGDCGACTVVLAEPDGSGTARYRAVNSCLLFLPMVDGLEVWTAEGIARGGALHPVQAQMVAHGGSQCGYCTPGFVMSLFAEYYRPGRREVDEEALVGNLCRCTGYVPIRAAARALGALAADDPFARPALAPATTARPLGYESGAGRFHRPATLAALFPLLGAHPDARILAGATDLALEVTKRFQRLPVLISLDGIGELQAIRADEDSWEIGAGVTLSRLGEELRGACPALDQMLVLFASRQIRNRATVGGNLVTASPIGDLAPVLLALDAEVRIAGRGGLRSLPLSAFFTAYRRTALAPGEILAAVRVPRGPALGAVSCVSRAYKVAKSRRTDISTVAAGFALHFDAGGRIVRARLAYGGVAPTPALAPAAQEALEGRVWDRAALEAAVRVLADEFTPISDLRGSAEYRRLLIGNLLERFFEETGAGATA